MSFGMQMYLDFVVFVFGAVIGSFLNVCIHRLPRDQSIIHPPSHCPHCNERVRWFDNIPLVSFLVLRGKCRHCHAAISARYFVVELLTAVLFLTLWWWYGVTWHALIYAVLVAGLIAATFIDFEHYIIPDEITIGGLILGVLVSGLYPPLHGTMMSGAALLRSLGGLVVGGVVLLLIALLGEKIFKKEAMGMGDVKLLAALGAFLGWPATLFIVFTSSMLGGVVGLTLVLTHRKEMSSRLPYGPYIAAAAVLWLFWGPPVVLWYLGTLTAE